MSDTKPNLRPREVHVCELCGEQSTCASWRHICKKQSIYGSDGSNIKIAKMIYMSQIDDDNDQMFKIGSSRDYKSFSNRHKPRQTYSAKKIMYHRVYELLVSKTESKTITAKKLDNAWRKAVKSQEVAGVISNKAKTGEGGEEIYAVTGDVQIEVKFEEWLSHKEVRFARRSINPHHYKNGHYIFADASMHEEEKKWLFPFNSSKVPPKMPKPNNNNNDDNDDVNDDDEYEFKETTKTTSITHTTRTKTGETITTTTTTTTTRTTTKTTSNAKRETAKSQSKNIIADRYAVLSSSSLSYHQLRTACREKEIAAVGTAKILAVRLALLKWTKKELQTECAKWQIEYQKKWTKKELVNSLTK